MINVFGEENEFKKVVRYGKIIEGYYVDKSGNVYSSKRSKMLKQGKGGNPNNYDNLYNCVTLNGTTVAIHRLVMETHKPIDENPPGDLSEYWNQVITEDMVGQKRIPDNYKEWIRRTAWVDHVNGDKDDNHVDSLRWVTPRQNHYRFKRKNDESKDDS